ncbi:MAG: VWA domain-containing protein [Pseudomonadales bacterium]
MSPEPPKRPAADDDRLPEPSRLRFSLNRYSRWDGSQRRSIDATAAMDAMADDLMEYGDMRWALRQLLSKGMALPDGGHLNGLQDLLKTLRQQKRAQLERYNLDSIFENFRERLDDIERHERATIQGWQKDNHTAPTNDSAADGNFSSDVLQQIAQNNEQTLDNLPTDLAARIKALEQYEFLNPDAQRDFLELLNELRDSMASSFFKDIENMVQNLSAGDIDRMKDMIKALNAMLVKKIAGEDPQFDAFMAEFGDLFGDQPPQSLDELLEQMANRMAAAEALMQSLSAEQQQTLRSLLDDRLGDPELAEQLRKLAKEMDFLQPGDGFEFSGANPIELQDALNLMDQLGDTDALLDQLQRAVRQGELDGIDREALRKLLGDDAVNDLGSLEALQKTLEEAGYMQQDESGHWDLTASGSRLIGQRALGEIYQRLKRQNLGNHAVPEEGRFGERLEQTKPYEFGDPFHLHMPRTIRNAIARQGSGTPVNLQADDFEIYRSEQITSTATALLVDLSWSMALRGSFQAAKKVALALHNLITSQYPKDSFYVIGFAAYAKELKPRELPFLQWDEYVLGTNMQHALVLAEKLLAKHKGGSKQIIMISDGEPTSHLENGEAQFAYPPTPTTLRATLRAVKHCTARGIAINTFMLEESEYLRAFMDEIARINGGRVFYTSPEKLGEYILVDYVAHKRKKLRGRN